MYKCSLYFYCEYKNITPFFYFVYVLLYTRSIPILPKIVVSLLKNIFLSLVALFVSSPVFTLLINFFHHVYSFFLTVLRTPLLILPFLLIFVLCPSLKCVRIIKLFYSCLSPFSNLLLMASSNLQFSLIRAHILTRMYVLYILNGGLFKPL